MKVTYFVALFIMISVSDGIPGVCHERDPLCICEHSGGFPDNLETVCCRDDCKACDDHTNCGHNGGNPWCCSTTILHNHGECTDSDAVAPCIRIDIRKESGGFEWEDTTKYYGKVIGYDDINDKIIYDSVGWRSTGFVVQLMGKVSYVFADYIADGGHVLVGKLSMESSFGTNFCPIVDQTFIVTNDEGLSVSLMITDDCQIIVKSWGIHKVYFNAENSEFFYLENFYTSPVDSESDYQTHCSGTSICEQVIRDSISIYEQSKDGANDGNQLLEMNYFDLGGITYIGQYIKNVEMVNDHEDPSDDAAVHFMPEINFNLIYGLLISGLVLWECAKCYIHRKGNSPYGKVQVHYLDESSQCTDIDVQ